MHAPRLMQHNLNEVLEHLGLSASEGQVFTYLLESGRAERISTISKNTKVNRTTLYGILKTLSKRGLVSSVEDGGILTYRSIQPHLLVDYIERSRERLSSDIERVRDIVPVIEQVRKTGGKAYPAIQYFDGVEGLKQAYEDTIRNNSSKVIYGFTGTDTVLSEKSIDMDWIEYYIARRKKAGVEFLDIATASKNEPHWIKARDSKDFRLTKVLPPGFDFDIELAIYENKILIASFAKEHPLAVLIEDEKVAKTMKELFRYIDSTLSA